MRVRKPVLILAVSALLGLMASPVAADSIVRVGIEDHPGITAVEGNGDFNDMMFALIGNISVLAASADQLPFSASVVNQSGSVFWDNHSYDGNDYNFGYCLLEGGTCTPGHSLGVSLDYVATGSGGAPVSELFQASGAITAMLLAEVTSNFNSNTLGWYDPSNPSVLHQIFAGPDNTGAVATFIPTGTFALYSTNGIGQFYSSVASANVNESGTQQHFALADGVVLGPGTGGQAGAVPEPGTGGLAGAVLAAAWVGRTLRKIRPKPTQC
jgi:hypothetical protein